MYFLIGIALGLFCAYRIYKSDAVSNTQKFSVLILKIVSAIGIGWYYMEDGLGKGDTWSFFNMGLQIIEMPLGEIVDFYLSRIPTQIEIDSSRTAIFLKFLIPLILFGFKNYWFTAVLSTLISFTIILKGVEKYKKAILPNATGVFLVICLIPSTLIWTSGIFKENLAFIALLLILFPIIEILDSKRQVSNISILIGILAFYLFFELRYFLSPTFLLIALSIIYTQLKNERSRKIFQWASLIIGFFLILLLTFHPVINIIDLPEYIFMSHHMILENFSFGIDLHYQIEDESWIGVLKNIPMAFVNIFIRPFPWEWDKIEYAVFALENYFLFTLILTLIWYSDWKINKTQWFQCAVIVFALLIIAISTPNFGSLFRYKSIILPFLVLVFLLRIDRKLI